MELFVMMSLVVMNHSLWAANSFSWQDRDNETTHKTINDQEGRFQLTNVGLKEIEMSVQANHAEWKITLIAPNREDFQVGQYRHLQEYPVDNHAGMRIAHDFTVLPANDMVIKEIKTDGNGNVISLAFDFRVMQQTYVAVRYQSEVPDDLSDYVQSSTLKSNVIEYYAPGGLPTSISKRNDDYSAYFSILGDRLQVMAMGNKYDFEFSAPIGQKLIENNWYEKAKRFATPTAAGIDIDSCSDDGRFIIRELELNKYYEIKHLAVDYEYSCFSGGTELGNIHTYGALRYNSNTPITIAPPADYQAETQIITVPFAINVKDFTYQPVRLQFKVTNINPLEVELISIVPVNPADFQDIHVPAGSEKADIVGNPRFTIPYIRSQALLSDVKAYALILQKQLETRELKVGDTFTLHQKIVL